MARGSRDLLKLLANGTNRDILSLLRAEATYPRRLAELVGITEGEAQKRLRQMEQHGLVKGEWVHVGKNVKRYTLQASALRIEVGPDGLALALEGSSAQPVKLAASQEEVPAADHVVGRAAELAALAKLLEEKGAAAVVGIAGTGKTSLAARFARSQASPAFWTTLRGTEGAPQLLSRLAVFLGARGQQESVASFVHLDGTHDLNAQMAVVAEGLGRAGALVVVDDVHLAKDDALRQVLGFLAERAGGYRLLLAGRSLPKGLPRARLGLQSLGGLDPEDTGAFLGAKGLDAQPEEARAVQAKTGGHPLALTLLAETARGRGVGAGELARLLPETRIESYLWDEVFSDLGPEDRDFLTRVSVLRGPVDAPLAEAVSGDARARERFFVLERRDLCVPVGERYAVHDVVRQFAGRLGRGRAEAHARAASALEGRGGVADALEAMHHWLEAGDARSAFAIARRELGERPYRFVDTGMGEAYGALLERLAPQLQGQDRAVALLELASCRWVGEGALRVLDEAAPLLGPRAPVKLRLRHLFLQAEARYRSGATTQGARLYARVVELARRARDEGQLLDALNGRANALEDVGRMAEAEKAYASALQRARRARDLRRTALLEAGLARVLSHRNKRAEALRHLEAGLEAARLVDDVRAEANIRRALGEYWLHSGDYERAWEDNKVYIRAARRLGDPWSICCALMDGAWIAQQRRAFGDVEPLLAEVERIHQRTPLPFFFAQAEAMRMVVAAAFGRWAEFERLARTHRYGSAEAFAWFYGTLLMPDLKRALHQALRDEARPAVERLLRDRKQLEPWVRGVLEEWAGAGARPGAAPAKPRAAPRRAARASG